MPITVSIIPAGVNSHATSSEEANGLATDFFTAGVVGTVGNTSGVAPMTGGFALAAQATPTASYTVNPGKAYVTATPTGQGSQLLRVVSTDIVTLTANPNATGATRYDWVYVKVDPALAINPSSAGDNVASLYVSRATSNTTDDGTPPSYGTLLAVVTVAPNFANIGNGNIADKRTQAGASTSGSLKLYQRRTAPTSPVHSGSTTAVWYNGFAGSYTLSNMKIGKVYRIALHEPNVYMTGVSGADNETFYYLIDGNSVGSSYKLHDGSGLGETMDAICDFQATATTHTLQLKWGSNTNTGTYNQDAGATSPATLTVSELG